MTKSQGLPATTDRWVLIDLVIEHTGYTKNAIYAKKKGGVWTRGRFWVEAPDGRIAFNLGDPYDGSRVTYNDPELARAILPVLHTGTVTANGQARRVQAQ